MISKEEFFSRVIYSDDCWEWGGVKNKQGYGRFYFKGKQVAAHRWSYEYFIGKLGGLHCCHHCDNPGCVNPFHLFAGTAQDNVDDKMKKGRHQFKDKPLCKNGHKFTKENTIVKTNNKTGGNYRICKACRIEYQRSRRRTGIDKEYQRKYQAKRRLNFGPEELEQERKRLREYARNRRKQALQNLEKMIKGDGGEN